MKAETIIRCETDTDVDGIEWADSAARWRR